MPQLSAEARNPVGAHTPPGLLTISVSMGELLLTHAMEPVQVVLIRNALKMHQTRIFRQVEHQIETLNRLT